MFLRMRQVIFLLVNLFSLHSAYPQTIWSGRMASTAMALWPAGTPVNWNYEQGLIMRSIETLWNRSNNKAYYNYIQAKADYFVTNAGSIRTYNISDYNLDMVASGRALIFLYNQTGLTKYKSAADLVRSQLTNQPRTASGGFWHKKIYPDQMWLDGLFMAEPFYAEYAALFNQPVDFDDVSRQLILMENISRDSATGLLYHGWDESKLQAWANPATGLSPSFWGRAMGWYAMSLVDVLDNFPSEHPKRDTIISILNRLSTAIVRYQDKNSGLWFQVLDRATEAGNYPESSVSCMFVYTLAKAVRMGYIKPTFLSGAVSGYDAIIKTFLTTDLQGKVHLNGICPVAGLGGNPYRSGTYEYYISSKGVQDDPKGIGSFILASVEMEFPDFLLNMSDTNINSETKIFPNPATDKVFIEGLTDVNTNYKVYDMTGMLLLSGIGLVIEISHLKTGCYFIKSENSGKAYLHKIFKK